MISTEEEITQHFVRAWYYYANDNSIYHIHLSRAMKLYGLIEDLVFINDVFDDVYNYARRG